MAVDASAWQIEELGPGHDRVAFSCGQASLDKFLQQFASQNQTTGISRTFVAVRPGNRTVLGYYSIAAGSVRFEDLTKAQSKRLPRYPVPVAHLGRLAVDESVQGRGLGSFLLLDALSRISRVDRAIGIHAVEVIALDAEAKQFYQKYGFTALRDDPHPLFISHRTIRKLGLS